MPKQDQIFIAILIILAIIVIGAVIWVVDDLNKVLVGNSVKNIIKNETADWQIYKNKKYGFELKYPNDLTIQEGENGVTFLLPQTKIAIEKMEQEVKEKGLDIYNGPFPELGIFIQPVPEKPIFGQAGFDIDKFRFMDTEAIDNSEKYSLVESSAFGDQIDITINNQRALICEQPYGPPRSIILVHDNKLYHFALGKYDGPKDFSDKNNVYNKILSSFKFTK